MFLIKTPPFMNVQHAPVDDQYGYKAHGASKLTCLLQGWWPHKKHPGPTRNRVFGYHTEYVKLIDVAAENESRDFTHMPLSIPKGRGKTYLCRPGNNSIMKNMCRVVVRKNENLGMREVLLSYRLLPTQTCSPTFISR
jgi:hypothetical protein